MFGSAAVGRAPLHTDWVLGLWRRKGIKGMLAIFGGEMQFAFYFLVYFPPCTEPGLRLCDHQDGTFVEPGATLR